jgi:hypothetical protein
MTDHATSCAPSRREFHAVVALLAATPLAALAADEKAPAVDALTGTADGLVAAAKARYGAHLTAEQFAEVEKSIRGGLARAEAMKKTPLKNGVEPAFAFSADVP